MDYFVANTQYNDMKGTAAADEADFESLTNALREKSLASDEEVVVGISFYYLEGSIFVRALLASLDDLDKIRTIHASGRPFDKKLVRVVRMETDLTKFFRLFKRFDVKLALQGLETALQGIDIDAYETVAAE